jgi:SAM-dependent methyltransferase
MNYRDLLYDTYVSNNKIFLRQNLADPDGQVIRNLINLHQTMSGWLDEVPRDGKALDVACGAGNILQWLKIEGFVNLFGVDISQEQVEIARQQFPEVVCGDAIAYLEKHPEEFQLITAFDILEHFTKQEAVRFLTAIYGALTPGGRLILQLPNGDSPFAGAVVHGDLTHEVTYTTVSLRHLLLASGFQDIQFQEHAPQPTSLKGLVRCGLWSLIRQLIKGIHLIETGGPSTQVYTRVMRATVVKAN